MPDVQEVFRMATQKVRPDPGAMERQSHTQRRHVVRQRAGGYALLAILVIAAGVIGVIALRDRELQPASEGGAGPTAGELATNPYILDLGTGETTLLPETLAGGFAYVPSPDGTQVAFAGNCEAGDVVRVANIDGTGLQTFRASEGMINCAPRWSRDGSKLVYQERDPLGLDIGNLIVHDLASGQRTQVTDIELANAEWWFLSPSFTADGQSVLFHLPRSSSGRTKWDVWSVPVTGGEPTLVLRDATFPMDTPVVGLEEFQIVILEPRPNHFEGERIMTGRTIPDSDLRQTLVEANDVIWWPTMSPDGSRIAYEDGGSIYVVELMTGAASEVTTNGETAEWLDNDTLILAPAV